MPEIGQIIAHYRILEKIGKGGMGEVYRARDQKLGRDVAIKVLPEEFAKDADRVARFQREAKLLASLNHPNIAAIYGLEECEVTSFLVLELIEGDTLADRIKGGPIPVEEALKLALQIAEALEAAHEKGVIHRDLKPANIKVTPDGKVKVLDFGLAKAFAEEQEASLSNSPTLSEVATMQGVILGTAAYMSPEQARGKRVDKRTDIWAFGCVFYEMLSGKAAFQGEDVTEILAAVVKSGVDLDLLPANIHTRVREAITRCLQKEQKKRYRDIGDAQYEIEQVLAAPSGIFVQPVEAAKSQNTLQVGLPWVAAAVAFVAIIAALAGWRLKPSEPRRVVHFSYELPAGQQFSDISRRLLAVSPDGSQFAYSTQRGLYLRSLEQTTAKLIPHTDQNSQQPVFSPDGKWICYWSAADGQLKKIALSGGAPITLCRALEPRRPTWSVDDMIVFVQSQGIVRISSNGGTPELLVDAEGQSLGEAQILPDRKTVLFSISNISGRKIAVQSLKSGKRKELFAGDSARYISTGHIIYCLDNNIFAVPFDLDSLEVTGGAVSMVEGVMHSGVNAHSQYAFSDSGMLVYTPEATEAGTERTLVWVDRNGKEEPIPAPPKYYTGPRISPDGTRVALAVTTSENQDIWVWDLIRKTLTRLTFDDGIEAYPVWTRDSKRIAFYLAKPGKIGVSWKSADGTGEEEFLGSVKDRSLIPWSWSADGKTLALSEAYNGNDIGMLSIEGERKHKTLLSQSYSEVDPQISPDGRWIAYTSNESGKNEIYVRPFPNFNGGRWQVSTNGGSMALWSPGSRELFYRNGDAVMAVPVEIEPAFKAGTPISLFRGTYVPPGSEGIPWDISPDGKRFLMMKPTAAMTGESTTERQAAAAPRPKINIVLNWFEELKQRVPAR